jgi:membrane-associated protease RseP (regulator of RpoE activity)
MFPSVINILLSFVAALVAHELGHYIAARLCKIPVTQAGLGWGPRLFSTRIGEVECNLRLLPLGAYIRMDMAVFQSRPLAQQLLVLGAGIAVNLVLCILTAGTFFGTLNLGLAIGNLLPLYQQDGWKSGMVISRRLFGKSNLVEWSFTIAGGVMGLALIASVIHRF